MDGLLTRGLALVGCAALGLCAALGACSSSSSSDPKDASTPDTAIDTGAGERIATSKCGQPGDKGNSIGVGLFCRAIADCFETPEPTVCTQLGDPDRYYCTKRCDPSVANVCGEDAACGCKDGDITFCGCVPARCGSATPPSDAGTDADAADAAGG